MGSVRGDWDPERAAWDEARRLGHEAPGPYHGLLALLRRAPNDLARRALNESGLAAERFERWVRHRASSAAENDEDLSAGWDRVLGRSEGFAVALGQEHVRSLDLLLGLLWDPFWHWVWLHHGIRAEVVLGVLASEVAVPPASALPEPDPAGGIRGTQRVLCPRSNLSAVLQALNENGFGAGTAYGFTLPDDPDAWIVAEDGFPVEAVIIDALTRPTES